MSDEAEHRTDGNTQRAGTVAAVLGVLILVWAGNTIHCVVAPPGPFFFGMHLGQVLALLAVLAGEVACGALLLVGGLGFRQRKNWARRVLLGFSWFGIVLCVLAAGAAEVTLAHKEGISLRSAAEMLMVGLLAVALLLLLWTAREYFSSREMREACRSATKGRRPRWTYHVLAGMVLLVVIPMAVFWVWRVRASMALSSQLEELRREGAVLETEEWEPALPPPEKNGAALFKSAFKEFPAAEECLKEADLATPEMPPGLEFRKWMDLVDLNNWSRQQAAYAEKVVACYADTLPLLRKAAARPHVVFDWDYSQGYDMPVPELSKLRTAAGLFCLSARVELGKAQRSEALREVLLALRIARFPDLDEGPMIQRVRMESAVRAVCCAELILREGNVPDPLLDALSGRLEAVRNGLDTEKAVRVSRASVCSYWPDLKRGRWDFSAPWLSSPLQTWLLQPALCRGMVKVLDIWTRAVRATRKPLWQALPVLERLDEQVERADLKARWELLNLEGPDLKVLVSGFSDVAMLEARGCAFLDSLRIALAMRRYRSRTGKRPRDLSALEPDYLDDTPPDPFTGEDFRTKISGAFLTVYSVGRDGKDDAGEIERPGLLCDGPDTGVRILW